MRYLGQMTGDEIQREMEQDLKEGRTPTVIIAIGPSGEYHGNRLPIDNDNIAAERVVGRLAEKEPYLFVHRVLPVGYCGLAQPRQGTFSIRPETLKLVVRDLSEVLVQKGFKRIIFFSGHGGETFSGAIKEGMVEAQKVQDFEGHYRDFWNSAAEVITEVTDPAMDMHGGMWETSFTMYLAPETIREDVPPKADQHKRLEGGRMILSESGIDGDPTKASAEVGRRIVEATLTHLSTLIH